MRLKRDEAGENSEYYISNFRATIYFYAAGILKFVQYF